MMDEHTDDPCGDALLALERSGERGLVDWLARHPADAREVARQVEALRAAGLVELEGGVLREERIGPYEVLALLGSGATGRTLLAWTEGREELVALKILAPAFAQDPHVRERLARETRALQRVDDPRLVRCHGLEEHEGELVAVLEYVPGVTLEQGIAQLVARRNAPEAMGPEAVREAFELRDGAPGALVDAALAWGQDLASALGVLHRAGIVHRDVKPANVIVEPSGRARLVDLGLAHLDDAERMTWSGDIVGTPRYLAPEVVRHGAGHSDHRVDLFSLGACLHELVTLRTPFDGVSTAQVLDQLLRTDPPRVSTLHRGAPTDLDAVLFAALEKEPSRRYADAETLRRELSRVASRERVEARTPGPVKRLARWARRDPWPAALLATVVLGALGTSAVVALYSARVARTARIADEGRGAAEKSVSFLVGLLEEADVEERGPSITGAELVAEGARRIHDESLWPDSPWVRARLARSLGALSWGTGDLDGARGLLELGQQILGGERPVLVEPHEWELEAVRCANFLGNVHRAGGELDRAVEAYRGAARLVDEVDDPDGASVELVSTVYGNLASVLEATHQLDEAEVAGRRAIEGIPADDPSRRAGLVWAHVVLARIQIRADRKDAASDSLESARALAASAGSAPLEMASILDAAATLATAIGDHTGAISLLEREVQLLESTEGTDARVVASARLNLGEVCRLAKRHPEAIGHLERALEAFEELGADDRVPAVQLSLGWIRHDAGQHERAVAHGTAGIEAAARAEAGADPWKELGLRNLLARARASLGQEDAARAEVAAARAFVAERLADVPHARVDAGIVEARVEATLGRPAVARAAVERCLEIARAHPGMGERIAGLEAELEALAGVREESSDSEKRR